MSFRRRARRVAPRNVELLPIARRDAARVALTDCFKFTTIFFVPRRAYVLALPPSLLNREPLNRGAARHFKRPDASLDATRGPPDAPTLSFPPGLSRVAGLFFLPRRNARRFMRAAPEIPVNFGNQPTFVFSPAASAGQVESRLRLETAARKRPIRAD